MIEQIVEAEITYQNLLKREPVIKFSSVKSRDFYFLHEVYL